MQGYKVEVDYASEIDQAIRQAGITDVWEQRYVKKGYFMPVFKDYQYRTELSWCDAWDDLNEGWDKLISKPEQKKVVLEIRELKPIVRPDGCVDGSISAWSAEQQLSEIGYRFADIRELCALVSQYPNIWEEERFKTRKISGRIPNLEEVLSNVRFVVALGAHRRTWGHNYAPTLMVRPGDKVKLQFPFRDSSSFPIHYLFAIAKKSE